MIRATTAFLPAGGAYIAECDGRQVMFANQAMWPDDREVIRLDYPRCDPRRESVIDLFWTTIDEALKLLPAPAAIVDFVTARTAARQRVPEGQVSLF